MKAINDLSAEHVRSLLSYDPLSGDLRWVKTVSQRSRAGEIAGRRQKDGRRRLKIDGRAYIAARLIWLMVTGEWPQADIDHRDLDPSNNRWKNLRPASRSQNRCNTQVRKDNALGVKGVWFDRTKGRYIAQTWANGKQLWRSRHKTEEEAARAYRDAAIREHGEFARF